MSQKIPLKAFDANVSWHFDVRVEIALIFSWTDTGSLSMSNILELSDG